MLNLSKLAPYCSLVIVDMDIRKLSINSDMLRSKPQKHENHRNMEKAIKQLYYLSLKITKDIYQSGFDKV